MGSLDLTNQALMIPEPAMELGLNETLGDGYGTHRNRGEMWS